MPDALPNIHPAIIHFPIALAVVAFAIDLLTLALPRRKTVALMAAALWGLAAIGAMTAAYTGEQAEESLVIADSEVKEAVERHEGWADRTVFALIAVALVRLGLAGYARRRGEMPRLGLALGLGLGAVALWCLFETAEHGGELVYRHGVGVEARVPVLRPPDAETE